VFRELEEDEVKQFILNFDFDELVDTRSSASYKNYGLIKQAVLLPAFFPRWGYMIQQMSRATEIAGFYYKIDNVSAAFFSHFNFNTWLLKRLLNKSSRVVFFQ
jgi:hypothetical protein